MKKLLPVIVVVLLVAVGGVWFFVIRDPGEPPEVRIEHLPGDVFTVNVAPDMEGNPSNRLLMAGVVLVVNSESAAELLIEENNRVRDTIITVLREHDEMSLRQRGRLESLRDRIAYEINARLEMDNVVEVMFNEFVMA